MTDEKEEIRNKIWKLLEDKKVAAFPLPVKNRIPNFVGSKEAARKLTELKIWKDSKTIAVNPDAPQKPIREIALEEGKTLVMSTPRLQKGFLLIEPKQTLDFGLASTIKGAFKFGKLVSLEEIPLIDLFVVGSVAVNLEGLRIGKGEGYSEIEWALLRTKNKVNENVPIVTTVHELQVVDINFSYMLYDLPLDVIVTPRRVIWIKRKIKKPDKIYWDLMDENKIKEISVLRKLKLEYENSS
ncbi:MAG: 5-formyltetrahydrofolate cyclo-ligase [Thermoproteota archaeon]